MIDVTAPVADQMLMQVAEPTVFDNNEEIT